MDFGITKLKAVPRKTWIAVGVGSGVFLYWRHRRNVNSSSNDIAGATDPTVAGATQDQYGNQVFTGGTATDAGSTPMSAYDPYTSGYNGYGYDLLLGSGGIVRPTGVGSIAPQAVNNEATSQNPSAPGVSSNGPAQVNVNYQKTITIEAPSKAQRDTAHRAIHKSIHNVKNGRHADKHRQNHRHHPRKENKSQVEAHLYPVQGR